MFIIELYKKEVWILIFRPIAIISWLKFTVNDTIEY